MASLRPVDPDEELPQEGAGRPAENHSEVETPADTQPASLAPTQPMSDPEGDDSGAPDGELIDNLKAVDSDPRVLRSAADARESNLGSTSSDVADQRPYDATTDLPATIFDSSSASAEADAGLDAEHMPAIDPVDAGSLTDVIRPPGNSSLDLSANHAELHHSWPDSNAELHASQQTSLPLIEPTIERGNVDAPPPSAAVEPAADRLSSHGAQTGSREGGLDNRAKHDGEPVTRIKSDRAGSQAERAPAERQEGNISREELEAFLEKFGFYTSRTRALLSPAPDGGPPMARPIVLVSLLEEQMQAITNEALAESGSRLAKTAAEVAEDKVNEAFWLRDCEMRALYRGR